MWLLQLLSSKPDGSPPSLARSLVRSIGRSVAFSLTSVPELLTFAHCTAFLLYTKHLQRVARRDNPEVLISHARWFAPAPGNMVVVAQFSVRHRVDHQTSQLSFLGLLLHTSFGILPSSRSGGSRQEQNEKNPRLERTPLIPAALYLSFRIDRNRDLTTITRANYRGDVINAHDQRL